MMNIIRNSDTAELSKAAVHTLLSTLEVGDGNGVLLLLSGGSALGLVADLVFPLHLVSEVTIGMIDERYDTDPSVNNFLLFKDTGFYWNAHAKRVSFIDSVPVSNESLEEFAERIATLWEHWMSAHPKGKIVALLGVGPDGHTAGVLPFPQDPVLFDRLFLQTPRPLVGYDAEGKNPYPLRATATLGFLRDHVDESLVFVSGVSKYDALKAILKVRGEIHLTPARILKEMKRVQLFTDIIV